MGKPIGNIEDIDTQILQLENTLEDVRAKIHTAEQDQKEKAAAGELTYYEREQIITLEKQAGSIQNSIDGLVKSRQKMAEDLKREQKPEVESRLRDLKKDYDLTVINIISTLAVLWKASIAWQKLYVEITNLSIEFNVGPRVYKGSVSIGNLNLVQISNLFLRVMEEFFPDECKKVDYPRYSERIKSDFL